MKTLQNFFKTTIPTAWAAGTGNRYVTTLPTPTSGWLVVSPNNASLREIVRYTATGSDGGGNYITIAERGIGGTTDQAHAVSETVRMNITAEHWADIYVDPVFTGDVTVPTPTNGTDAVTKDYADGLAIAGAPDATTSTKGITKMSVAPVSAASPIAVGDNDPRVPTTDEKAAMAGTSGTPSVSNKFVTTDDVSSAGASGKIVRLNGTTYPAGDGSNLTGINPSVTLGEDVVAGDLLKLVNESGNAKLKKIIGIPSATTTASGGTISGELMSVWLSSNLCVFAWKESGGTTMGVVAGTYSGGTWTFGTDVQYTVGAGVFYDFGLTRVSSTGFAVVMRAATNGGAGNYLYGVAGTVSGTTITSGSVTSIDSNANTGDNNARVLKLFTLPGTSTCVCTYRFQTASTCVRSIVFTVSGTAITGGTPSDADTGNGYGAVTGCPLSASKFVVAFSDDGASTRKVRVATISGTTITYGTLTTVTFTSGNFSATQLDTDAFVLVGKDVSTTTTMLKRIFTVSSTTPTQGTLYTDTTSMTSGTGKDFSVAIIGTILYVVRSSSGTVYFYKYRYNSTDGTFILIASYSSSTIATSLAINSLYAANVYNSDRLIISGANSNDIINVVGLPDWDEFLTSSNSTYLSGVSLVVSKIMTGFSSLIPSARYYIKADMTTQGITTDNTYQYVGRAVSSTTIYNDNQ